MAMNYNGYGVNGYNNQYMQQYQPPQPVHTPQVQQSFKIIPISNKNETNAIIADLNGTPLYFHNLSNNEIYIKQFDIKTGLTSLQEFQKIHPENVDSKENEKVTFETSFNAINERLDGFNNKLDKLLNSKVENVENKGSKKQ